MDLIDTHCHLDEEAFNSDRDEVIARAVEEGIVAAITIGITAETSRRAVELAEQHPSVYAVVGIQPNYAAQAKPGDLEIIESLITRPKVVGIGETGLDRYWDYAPIELQQEYFTKHIELSRQYDLPFVVHCRDAEDDVVAHLRLMAESGPLNGVMHSFCGDLKSAQACLDLGLHISFSGMVTYKKNKELREVASQIPLDRIMIETDAPYLAPTPKRGKRNEPAFVKHTLECLAEVHGIDPDEMARRTTKTSRRLFWPETTSV